MRGARAAFPAGAFRARAGVPRWALVLLGAAACGEAGEGALRAGGLLLALGAAALLVRRRRGARPTRPLRLEERQPLGRDCGVAVVRASEERLLVGYGRGGVRLLRRLGPREGPP